MKPEENKERLDRWSPVSTTGSLLDKKYGST